MHLILIRAVAAGFGWPLSKRIGTYIGSRCNITGDHAKEMGEKRLGDAEEMGGGRKISHSGKN